MQIEPFRNKPDIDQSKKKGGYDYIKTTKIQEQATLKIVALQTAKLWLEAQCNDCEEEEQNKEFLKDGLFGLEALTWYEPVDNPMICLYTQNGNYRPRYNTFGKVRIERSKINHSGIDLLVVPDSNIYSCFDGVIVSTKKMKGYGKTIKIKANSPKNVIRKKRAFVLSYKNEGEMKYGDGFNFNKNIYVFYAHLKSINVKVGDHVIGGQIIGKSGTSGYGKTKDPHLHFEILNINRFIGGLKNRVHPGFFCHYKKEKDMSSSEKEYQKEISKKYWD